MAAATGAPVEDRRALGGTRLCWDALVSGALDLYPEYTGTLREEILRGDQASNGAPGDAPATSPRCGPRWRRAGSASSGRSGSTTATRWRCARRRRRVSASARFHLARHPELRIDLSNEFLRRRDGWPGLAARYALPDGQVQGLDHELAIRGLATGALDVTDIYSTDAEIARDGLRVLADDRGFFPRYQAILLTPRRRGALASGLRGAGSAGRTNRRRDDDPPQRPGEARQGAGADRRRRLRHRRFGVRGARPKRRAWPALWRRTREHLALVAVSLLAAILCACRSAC